MPLKLSPTKIGSWQMCPRRFFYSYVLKQRPAKAWAHLSYANAVHSALRAWFDLPIEARRSSALPELVSAGWSDIGFRDGQQASQWRDRAVEIIRAYLDDIDPDFEPLSTERTLAFKTDSFIMEGRIDRLDESGTEIAVVDYKTGRHAPDEDEVRGSAALAMYALMVQRVLGRACFDVALHHVPSGTKVTWRHSAQSLQRHELRVEQIAADISRAQDTWEATNRSEDAAVELFAPRPGPACGFCDFRRQCPVGQAATPMKESWEGLAQGSDVG